MRGIELVINKGRAGETYNIGGNSERQNIELVQLLAGVAELTPAGERRQQVGRLVDPVEIDDRETVQPRLPQGVAARGLSLVRSRFDATQPGECTQRPATCSTQTSPFRSQPRKSIGVASQLPRSHPRSRGW